MPWNWRHKEGFLRNLVIRESAHMPELMANLVTFGYDEEYHARPWELPAN